MNKYGVEHFHIELIEEVPIDQLSQKEIYWIDYYNSYKNGYNATYGGDGKQLYNYNDIVQGFLSGKLLKELAEEFGCCVDTIAQALKLANINTFENAYKKACHGIQVKDKKGNLLRQFSSRAEAAEWLKELGLTSKDAKRDNIIAAIGRAANGSRKYAYGMIWENI